MQARAAAPAGAGSPAAAPAPPAPAAVTPGRAKGAGASAPATPAKGAAPPGVHTRGRDSAAKPRQAAKSSDKRALSSTCAGFEVGWGSGVDVEGVTELVLVTGLHHILHGTHAGMVASHCIQGLAARARGVGPPRTLPVVDDAASASLLEGCGTSLPHATTRTHAHICHFNISLSCSIPSLSCLLLLVALHLGVLLALIVDCVLFQVPTPYSMPWWLAHHGTPRVASCTFQPCFRNVISFKLEAVSRGASLSSWGAPRNVLGEGYCDHGKGRQVSLLGGSQDCRPKAPPSKRPGPPTLLTYATCIYLTFQGHK